MPKYTIKLVGTFEAFDDIDARMKSKQVINNIIQQNTLGIVFDSKVVRFGSTENILKRNNPLLKNSENGD